MAILIRLLVIAFLIYWLFIRPRKPRAPYRAPSQGCPGPSDPYDILNIPHTANMKEIKKAYHLALSKYHPDKVDHLGEEIQSLAKEKTTEIMKAYEALQKQKTL